MLCQHCDESITALNRRKRAHQIDFQDVGDCIPQPPPPIRRRAPDVYAQNKENGKHEMDEKRDDDEEEEDGEPDKEETQTFSNQCEDAYGEYKVEEPSSEPFDQGLEDENNETSNPTTPHPARMLSLSSAISIHSPPVDHSMFQSGKNRSYYTAASREHKSILDELKALKANRVSNPNRASIHRSLPFKAPRLIQKNTADTASIGLTDRLPEFLRNSVDDLLRDLNETDFDGLG